MMQSPELSNYNDLSALQSLKSGSSKNSREGIKQVAEQFESMFISMMLKSMREANKGFSEGNLLSSNETDFYQEMFDSQVSVSLAGAGENGIGIAQVVERQLLEAKGLSPEPASGRSKPMQLADYPRKAFPSLDAQQLEDAATKIEQVVGESSNKVSQGDVSHEAVLPKRFDSPESFIKSLYPIAERVQAQTGISAKLMVAQSALETGWGERPILKQDGSQSFNLFGIKANHAWQGDKADILTTEYHAGVPLKQRDSFRAYGSFEESFKDYAQFLQSNPRYSSALAVKDQPIEFARALQKSGYATDPNYANKIERIIDKRLGQ